MGFLTITKKISGVSKMARRGSLTKGSAAEANNPDPSMDVPANVNVQQSTRRGLQRKNSSNFSTFSLISLPSFKRGISQHLENPHLDDIWKYDNNVYSNYDVSAEMKDPEDQSEKGVEEKDEEPFLAANPLPTGSSCSGSTSMDSWGPLSAKEAAAQTKEHDVVDSSSSTRNDLGARELIKQFVGDVWNSGDLTRIPDLCSPKILYNESNEYAKVGHAGVADMVRTIHEFFLDYHCEIHSMVVEGNKAFCRVRYSGKPVRPLYGYAATGQEISWMGAKEFTCKHGQIIRVWEVSDMQSLENQLRELNQQS